MIYGFFKASFERMKILALAVLRREPSPSVILAGEYDVSSFSFFQRTSVQEFLAFFATTLSDKTAPGMRQAVEQDSKCRIKTIGRGMMSFLLSSLPSSLIAL
jgi:hypothetical protein